MTIDDFLKRSVSKWPDKAAVIKNGAAFTYKQIDRQIRKLEKCLSDNSIKKGDRVGIFLEKNLDQIVSIFAVARAGAIFVILNNKLKKDQVFHIAGDCQIKGMITSRTMHKQILSDGVAGSSLKFLIFTEDGKYSTKRLRPQVCVSAIPPSVKNIACIIYTSGSTGKPKGVVVTHGNLVAGAQIVSQYLECRHKDRVLSLLPFSFDYGLNQLLTTFKNGASIILHDFVFPEDVLRMIEKEHISGLAGIPTIWVSLLNSPSIRKYNLSSLRYVTNSGGKIPVNYVRKMANIFKNTKIYLMYGLTEAFRSTYLPPYLVREKPDSIGKAIPRVKISVLSKDGKECKPGEEGELVHRGALISLGYWGNEEATGNRIRELPAGAKLRRRGEKGVFSGDIVKRDKKGFLYYLGRNDEMIKSSGYRISPMDIEDVLYQVEGVTAAVVFGMEDPMLGQRIFAAVAVDKDRPLSAAVILRHCAKELPDYEVPHKVVFMDQVPKTGSGKLDRSLIKEMYGEH